MTIILRALGGAVVVGLALGPVTAHASDMSEPSVEVKDGVTTLKFAVLTTKQTFTTKDGTVSPSPTAMPVPGDKFSFIEELRQGDTLIGTDSVECAVEPQDVTNCTGAFVFANGTIRAAGSSSAAMGEKFDITLLGGTGDYEGITGTGTVVNTDETHGNVVLQFTSAQKPAQVAAVPSGGAAAGGHNSTGDSLMLLGLSAMVALGGARLLAVRRT